MKNRIFFILLCCVFTQGYAANQQNYYRSFWNPTFHGKLLDYCLPHQKQCGMPVAHRYCQLMGYDSATKVIEAHDVGLTNYLGECVGCKGWHCSGFSEIVCVSKTLHQPVRDYYFRSKTFVLPRFKHYRVAWCYRKGHGCGKRAAFSFCRRMGYMREQHYKKANKVGATRALGDQTLCFGDECQAFSRITCYR